MELVSGAVKNGDLVIKDGGESLVVRVLGNVGAPTLGFTQELGKNWGPNYYI